MRVLLLALAFAAADPDRAFERLPSGASKGRCEPWLVD